MNEANAFKRWMDDHRHAVIATVSSVKGSTPREAGAFIAVAGKTTFGTIGGGQLEYLAIDHARKLLAGKTGQTRLDIPLGPDIGQCCGGRTVIDFAYADDMAVNARLEMMQRQAAAAPTVAVFGGGHVGKALCQALAPLPLNVRLIETRNEALTGLPAGITTKLTPMPEAEISNLPAGSAVVILTHDHALDFLIAMESLRQDALCYCGMIGSKTKRATFHRYAKENGVSEEQLTRLTMPVGGSDVRDKRPPVIAALVAAELLHAIHAANAAKTGSLHEHKANH